MTNEFEDEKVDRRAKFERDRQRNRTAGGTKDAPRKRRLEPYKRQNTIDYLDEYDEFEEYDE